MNPFSSSSAASFGVPCKPTVSPEVVSGSLTSATTPISPAPGSNLSNNKITTPTLNNNNNNNKNSSSSVSAASPQLKHTLNAAGTPGTPGSTHINSSSSKPQSPLLHSSSSSSSTTTTSSSNNNKPYPQATTHRPINNTTTATTTNSSSPLAVSTKNLASSTVESNGNYNPPFTSGLTSPTSPNSSTTASAISRIPSGSSISPTNSRQLSPDGTNSPTLSPSSSSSTTTTTTTPSSSSSSFFNPFRKIKSPPPSSSSPSHSPSPPCDISEAEAAAGIVPRKVFRSSSRHSSVVSSSSTSSLSLTSSASSSPALKPITSNGAGGKSSSSPFSSHSSRHSSESLSRSSTSSSSLSSSSASDSPLNEVSLLRVNFALPTFKKDPPQQIPARKPKLGNVKVNDETGQIIRPHHSLDASNSTAYSHAATMAKNAAYNSAVIVANSVRADCRRANRLATFGKITGRSHDKHEKESGNNNNNNNKSLSGTGASGPCQNDEPSDEQPANCAAERGFGSQLRNIDKPITKKSEFPSAAANSSSSNIGSDGDDEEEEEDDDDDDSDDSGDEDDDNDNDTTEESSTVTGEKDESLKSQKKKKKKNGNKKKKPLNLVDLYTRCCHLREILPIQATLRQLDGKSAPLSTLQLMNPRPTMIEILAFADFLAVAPITALILDNVDMTEEMFSQIILSLINAENMFKLSLRNVNITPKNWKLLCSFLGHNKWITKLDISLKFPEPGKKKIKYKQSEYYARENLDWTLLSKAIISRHGLEELNINSCYIPHESFRNLILSGVALGTKRLGVSCSDLEEEEISVLNQWITMKNSTCEGVDLSGNPAISKFPDFVRNLYQSSNLLYLSLNSCNLSDPVPISKVLSQAAPTSHLRFLDVAYNPKLFPRISSALFGILPNMPDLLRIYLDYNNMSSQDIILLADAIPKCSHLVHVSLTGNKDINSAAAESLAVSVKLSNTVTLVNIDAGILPASIARRLAHYCMQNMESLVNVIKGEDDFDNDGYNFEGEEEILDDGKEIVKAVNYVVDRNEKTQSRSASTIDGSPAASALAGISSKISEETKTQQISDTSSSLSPSTSEESSSSTSSSSLSEDEDSAVCTLGADGLAKRAIRIREKVQKKLHHLTENYKLRDMPDPIRDKLIRFWYLDKTLEGVIQRYEIASGRIRNVTGGMFGGPHGIHLPSSPLHLGGHSHVGGSSASPVAINTEDGDSIATGTIPNNHNNNNASHETGINITGFQSPFNFAVSSHIHSSHSHNIESKEDEHNNHGDEDDDGSLTETEDNSTGGRMSNKLQHQQAQLQHRSPLTHLPLPSQADAETPLLYVECSPNDYMESSGDATTTGSSSDGSSGGVGAGGEDGTLSTDIDDIGHDDFGVCVLPRRKSFTSMQAKAQAREEGEMYKVGLLLRHRQEVDSNALLDEEDEVDASINNNNKKSDGNSVGLNPSSSSSFTKNSSNTINNINVNNNNNNKAIINSRGDLVNGGENNNKSNNNKPLTESRLPTELTVNKTGQELRKIWLHELANSDNDVEEVLRRVRQMSPSDFESYFINMDKNLSSSIAAGAGAGDEIETETETEK